MRDINVTNSQENSYQTVRKTLESQKGNRTHKKQCTKLERNKQSIKHVENSARVTNVANNHKKHIQNSMQSKQNTFKIVRKTLT